MRWRNPRQTACRLPVLLSLSSSLFHFPLVPLQGFVDAKRKKIRQLSLRRIHALRVEFVPRFANGAVDAHCWAVVIRSAALVILRHNTTDRLLGGRRAGAVRGWGGGSRRWGCARRVIVVCGDRGGSCDGSRGGIRGRSCGGRLCGSRGGSRRNGIIDGGGSGSRVGRGIAGATGSSVPDSRAWDRVGRRDRVEKAEQYSRVIVGVSANEVKCTRRGQRPATANLDLRARGVD